LKFFTAVTTRPRDGKNFETLVAVILIAILETKKMKDEG
jgi:hypothetical protein